VLLRRLGPSPFPGAFPIVGLLQTCYEVIGERVVEPNAEDATPSDP